MTNKILKIVMSLMAIVLVSVSSYAQNYTEIVKDVTFKEWYLDFIKNSERDINLETLRKFMSDGEISEEELRTGYRAFGFNSYSELERNYSLQNERLRTVDRKYTISKFDRNEMFELFELADQIYGTPVANGSNCDRKLRNCNIVANVSAGLGHAGCVALDLTVVGGILCHGAVMTAHYAALDNCQLDYQDCKK